MERLSKQRKRRPGKLHAVADCIVDKIEVLLDDLIGFFLADHECLR